MVSLCFILLSLVGLCFDMKILTNMQSVQIGGIATSMRSFLQFLKKNNEANIDIVGVDINRKYSLEEKLTYKREIKNNVTIINHDVHCRHIHKALMQMDSLANLENEYKDIIDIFRKIILEEKPNLIVLNGTYIIPWCLYLAARTYSIPILLHYHGMISKETETWDQHSHDLMKQMEQTFDNDRLQYIFPSSLAKEVVEKEIFGHQISKIAILANSIPDHFFKVNVSPESSNIGIVGRWTEVKNPHFVMNLAKYNSKQNNHFSINMVTNIKDISKGDIKRLASTQILPSMNSLALSKFYGNMGAILCPSIYESYGNVPQEAVASGTPALVGNNMGVAEVFRRLGLEDFIVDFSSVKYVYEKAKAISPHRVGKKVRQTMRYELSSQKINTDLLNIYRQTSN